MSLLRRSIQQGSICRTISIQSRFASNHGAAYNEPTGNLFSEKPLKAGEKRKMEDWELPYYIGMFGGMGLAAVLLFYKPDTSMQTWARAEAMKRAKEA